MNAHTEIKAAPGKVYEAIAAITEAMGKEGISKGRRNQQQGYQFRGIEDVYKALNPLLAEHRLCIFPRILKHTFRERETARGGVLFYVTVKAAFDFVSAEDGSVHTACTFGEAMDSADKATNKAMSAAYKYAAFMTFCIPTEGLQDDADAMTHEVAPHRQPEPEEDFDAAATALRIEGLLRTATTKEEVARIWNVESRAERAKLKNADPNLYKALSDTLTFEQQRVSPKNGAEVPGAELTH